MVWGKFSYSVLPHKFTVQRVKSGMLLLQKLATSLKILGHEFLRHHQFFYLCLDNFSRCCFICSLTRDGGIFISSKETSFFPFSQRDNTDLKKFSCKFIFWQRFQKIIQIPIVTAEDTSFLGEMKEVFWCCFLCCCFLFCCCCFVLFLIRWFQRIMSLLLA